MAVPRMLASAKSQFATAFFAIAIAGSAVAHTEWLALWNAKLLDVAFSARRKVGVVPVQRDVVVIGIDVDDLREYKDPGDFWHPLYGRLFTGLARARPAVVGVVIVFPERSRLCRIPGLDQSLLKGLVARRG